MLITIATALVLAIATPAITIDLAHNTPREQRTREMLARVCQDYDLGKYVFTKHVIIEEQAINHAFPELTLNARFADSEDELLSSFVHEQLHWYLREHPAQMRRAMQELRRWYPRVPVGGREGAETEYSTYGHLIDCYLEIVVDRRLIGPERTLAVIRDKGHYTWIYQTVLDDEPRIASIARGNGLGL